MSQTGLPAQIRLAVDVSYALDSLHVFDIGKDPDNEACDSLLEIHGQYLAYRVSLISGGLILLAVQLMDNGDPPEIILPADDTIAGWHTVQHVLVALEQNEIRSLARPIRVGDDFTIA